LSLRSDTSFSRPHQENQKEYFDKEYSEYHGYKLDNWRVSYLRRIFLDLGMEGVVDSNYLDIGVGGSGYTVIEAARRGWNSFGTDISPLGMKKAKQFAKSELGSRIPPGFIVASAESLPFKDAAFGKLTMISVLEHVPDDKQAILEIARVLAPSGEFLMTIPNSYRRILPLFWLPKSMADKRVGHLRFYKAEDLVSEFARHGFQLKSVVYSGHLPKVLQIFLTKIVHRVERGTSRIWWKLEELDIQMNRFPSGMKLHLVMQKRN
jgi:ubiquinone/menaquinone biosynthesis C-methylase UbiE